MNKPDTQAPMPQVPRGPLLVGAVEVVHPTGGFVLIRPVGSIGRALERGTVLEARSDLGAVDLVVSPERNHAFLVADYGEEAPRVGDQVVFVPPLPTAADAELMAEGDSKNGTESMDGTESMEGIEFHDRGGALDGAGIGIDAQ